MRWNFEPGQGQKVYVDSPTDLLQALEALVDRCLEHGRVFAIIEHGADFCQLLVDDDADLHIETSLGDLAVHSGFDETVPEFEFLRSNFLPSTWHARAQMAANAMMRAWVDAGALTFPVALDVQIHPTSTESDAGTAPPQTEGAATIGFCLGADRPIHTFVAEAAGALGIEAQSLAEIHDALQRLVESDYGPLNRVDDWTGAGIVVELGTEGPSGEPWTVRFK